MTGSPAGAAPWAACSAAMVGPTMRVGGAFDARILQIASSLGYVVVNWTRDTEDWKPTTTADQIFARATQGVQGGDIILMHSQGPHTLEALPRIVKYLRGKGFELTTVSGVLE